MDLDEPFLPVSPRFDQLDPSGHMGAFCLVSVLEQRESARLLILLYGHLGDQCTASDPSDCPTAPSQRGGAASPAPDPGAYSQAGPSPLNRIHL